MESRVDKYKSKEYQPSRVEKNQDLYKMIYSAYDEFENYKVPLEEREISLNVIKKEKMNRSSHVINSSVIDNVDTGLDKKNDFSQKRDVYDIKELLDKVKKDNVDDRKTVINEENYLDKLHLKNNIKTNLDTIKEKYEEIILDDNEEQKLSDTANLSLEILSDLKSNDDTMISPPMKKDIMEDDIPFKKIKKEKVSEEQKKSSEETDKKEEDSFYSDMYKFKKKDFEDDDEDEEEDLEESNNSFLFKILIIISIIILIALILIYLIGYFSK